MRRLTKIAVALALVVTGLCYTTKPAKADLFGVSDSALLVQQILQFFQDMDISTLSDMNFGELIRNIDQKAKDMKSIVDIFENGQQGFSTFNNVVEVTRKLTRLTLQMNSYIRYLGSFGDDFDMTRCYYIYRTFNNKTKVVLRSMEYTLKSMKKLDTDGGGNMLQMIDNVIQQASSTLDTVSNECLSNLADEVHEYKMAKQGGKVEKTYERPII